MHKRLLNEALIELTITAKGPVLIKSGAEGADPTLPDMQFVRTFTPALGETVYLPGSSLKGAIRSYAEKIIRTVFAELSEEELLKSCCYPFASYESFCGRKLQEVDASHERYKRSCLACKVFGSTVLASRFQIRDAYPVNGKPKIEERTNVAIDRILGSVAAGPFSMEVVIQGEFRTDLSLRNFELWQLGLIGLVLRDLCAGWIRIGFGKSRGLGEVQAKIRKIILRYHGLKVADEALEGFNAGRSRLPIRREGQLVIYGLGKLVGQEEITRYGLSADDEALVDLTVQPASEWTAAKYELEGEEPAMKLFRACVEKNWKEMVQRRMPS